MRLFVAIDPSKEIKERLERTIEKLHSSSPRSKWVRPQDCHITLVFLGDTADEKVPAVAAAIEAAAARNAPLALGVRGGGCFGRPRRPRTLWADTAGDIDALAALQRDVEAALVPLGHKPDGRIFKAHITLARARDPGGDAGLASCGEGLRALDFGEARIDEVLLYRSDLSPVGPRYTALARAPLGSRRGS